MKASRAMQVKVISGCVRNSNFVLCLLCEEDEAQNVCVRAGKLRSFAEYMYICHNLSVSAFTAGNI